MRSFALLLSFPVLAGAPVQMKVLRATLTSGTGVEPRGPVPPARFEVSLSWPGAAQEFRLWHVREGDRRALERGASPRHLQGGQGRLKVRTRREPDGTWSFDGEWPGVFGPEDRLLIEVWSGKHRRAWSVTAFEQRFLPSTPPRPEDRGEK